VDVETMRVVYEKLLDLDHFQSHHEGPARGIGISPSLAGGRIYLVGNTGSTLVIKPGRVYEQLAKNRIEEVLHRRWAMRHERFVAVPAFDGPRMFLRGERYLYCLSEE
jgi:outer membrane protein assembly factor BamB